MRRRCDGGSDPGGGLPLQEGDTGYFFVREDDFVKKSAFFFVCFIQIQFRFSGFLCYAAEKKKDSVIL